LNFNRKLISGKTFLIQAILS